jgi:hypothetical protein
MKLKKSDILSDCAAWGACPESAEFRYSLPDEIEISDAHTLGNSEYVAWYLYMAVRNWPDNRYVPEIASALCATGDARKLYFAGIYWPDERYTSEIAEALCATGNAWYLYKAGLYWSGDRRKRLKH